MKVGGGTLFNKAQAEYGKVLCHGDEGFQLYVDEFVEECGNFVRLAAKLKQRPAEESEEREDVEMELYSSLSIWKSMPGSFESGGTGSMNACPMMNERLGRFEEEGCLAKQFY